MQYADVFAKIVAHTKEHGFIFQSSEVYDGLSAVYDYGPLGVLLKNNIRQLWWSSMVQLHDNIVGLDAAILMEPRVWKASGHVDAFSDPLIDNRDSKKRYRADVLLEDHVQDLLKKAIMAAMKQAKKNMEKEGKSWEDNAFEFDRIQKELLPKLREGVKAKEAQEKVANVLANNDMVGMRQLIDEFGIVDDTGSRNWTDVRQFNLMFKTQLGSVAGDAADIYLRPETAQGIFVNFLNVQKSMRMKLPFGIAQVGKAFRNEIVARQFIFRMREFEQMEMQFFVKPGTQMQWYEEWRERRRRWHRALGLPEERLRWKKHDKLAHYADAAVDIEFEFPFGFKEMEGIHSRTDFDLTQHAALSGRKLQYFDPEDNASYTPFVVETSVGLDRTFLAHLCNAYHEEQARTADGDSEVRTVLRLHPLLAPVTVAVFPLVKTDSKLVELANKLAADLRFDFQVIVDEKDAIGRRYRRQDAKGTPFCVTVDQDTVESGAVTIRHRDSMLQDSIPLERVREYLANQLDRRAFLQQL